MTAETAVPIFWGLLTLTIVGIAGLFAVSIWGADWVARKGWQRPKPQPARPRHLSIVTRELQQTAVVRLTENDFLYLSRHPIPFPRQPSDDLQPEVTE